jgi:hypothetical protein
MSSPIKRPDLYPTAAKAAVERDRMVVSLHDGRELTVPVAWFDWLDGASDEERADFEIVEDGQGICWDRLDDGISVPGLIGLPHS